MNAEDPLAALRDITLPEAVSWWPPAPGWWLLLALLLALAGLLLHAAWRRYQRNRYRRAAVALLRTASQHYQQSRDAAAAITTALDILRRVARYHRHFAEAVALSGSALIATLNRHAQPGMALLPEQPALLEQVLYAAVHQQSEQLHHYCEQLLSGAEAFVQALPAPDTAGFGVGHV